MPDSRLGHDRHKISPGYFVIPESKESAQDIGASLKETPLLNSGQAQHQNIKYSNKLQTTKKYEFSIMIMILLTDNI